ncbi:hypothetical protein BURK2_00181 [Burkholderiales bacterium]|nr:hypothetical protein BURK2_00181 [Burkholderiales bacterium]
MRIRTKMQRRTWMGTLAALSLTTLGAGSCWFVDGGPYRGGAGLTLTATGRFRVEQVDGVWWLVTPDGRPFFSAGINHVSSNTDYEPKTGRYPYHENILSRWGSEEAWADEALRRMDLAGVNTAGAWSELGRFRGRFPYTQIMGFSGAAPAIPGTGGGAVPEMRDYFSPAFEAGAAAHAEGARACASDPYCIGVFSDNELAWAPNLKQPLPFVDGLLRLPAGAPGKVVLQAFFEERYAGDVAAFNAAWNASLAGFDEIQALDSLSANWRTDSARAKEDRTAFRGRVAERYYRVAHDALRAVDPQLLILGDRIIAFGAAPEVVLAAAPFVDVLSINAYEWAPGWHAVAQALAEIAGFIAAPSLLDDLDEIHRLTGKPLLIGEFGYRAADAGLPNSWPPVYPILPTQTERADAYERYARSVLARPYVVGLHWFEWADQPVTGRFDGEDDNWGFVNLRDDVYPELFLRMWSVHVQLYETRLALAR